MIGYITLGTNDVAQAADFYQKLFEPLGAQRAFDESHFVAWQTEERSSMFAVIEPYDKQAASVGNGTMVALELSSIGLVDQLHALALSLGGTCEGAPGDRGAGFYSAYFRDLEGNKISVFHRDYT